MGSTVVRKKPFDWQSWFKSFGTMVIGFVGVLIAFYFTTTSTLKEHEKQFLEVGKKFDQFNSTLIKNYDDWAKTQKEVSEKAEKQREKFEGLFRDFGMNTAAVKVQVDTITKQLDSVTTKIDAVQATQKEDRHLLSNPRR
jgi:hypothetical protein